MYSVYVAPELPPPWEQMNCRANTYRLDMDIFSDGFWKLIGGSLVFLIILRLVCDRKINGRYNGRYYGRNVSALNPFWSQGKL